jgi:preprotein translocase subunit SecG
MNMVQASGPGGLPAASNTTSGATLAGPLVKDGDKASTAHGVLMALVALVLIPFDVIIIGLFKWPKLHVFTSSLVFLFVLVAMGLGIYVSTEYNRVGRPPNISMNC